MKHVKHLFGFWNSIFSISNPTYLFSYYYCRICLKEVGDLFGKHGLYPKDFGTIELQELWLNEKTPCLTIEEKLVKDLLE